MLRKEIFHKHWRAWAIAGLMALLCLPMLVEYFSVLQVKDYYKLWPLLVAVIAVLLVQRWRRAPVADCYAPRWSGRILLLVALPLMLFSLLYYTPWVAAVASIVFLAVGALHISNFRKVENLFGMWLLLLLFLRPPYQMMLRVMVWMENISSKTASQILDYASVIHTVQGNVIALPVHDFQIDEICSGWVSVVSTLATAAVIAVVRNRALLHSVSLLMLAVVSSWIMNIFRILILLSVKVWYDVDLLSGVYVVFYQLFSMLVALVLVLCADSLVSFFLSKRQSEVRDRDTSTRAAGGLPRLWEYAAALEVSRVLRRFASTRVHRVGGILFGMLSMLLLVFIAVEVAVIYYRPLVTSREFMYGEDQLTKIGKDSVVFDRPGWEVIQYNEEKRDFASIWGALSSTWRLKYHGLTVIMSLDYPFDDWHDVKACYSNIGWKISKEHIVDNAPAFQWPASETEMVLPNGDAGFILCSHSDHLGNTVEPKPTEHNWTMTLYRLHPDRMTPPFGGTTDRAKRTFYQTQCMVATPVPLDESTKEEVRLMYAQFREQTRQAIALRGR
ncbi:MAG: exosortase U [Akkermansiaceae bacterium]|nr:exosortase U [Akkermansiaceae bacterium]